MQKTGDIMQILIIVVVLILYGIGGRWRTTGWLPRSLYLVGGGFVAAFFLREVPVLFVFGAGAIVLSRVVPAHGWHKQPGEG